MPALAALEFNQWLAILCFAGLGLLAVLAFVLGVMNRQQRKEATAEAIQAGAAMLQQATTTEERLAATQQFDEIIGAIKDLPEADRLPGYFVAAALLLVPFGLTAAGILQASLPE